MDFIITGDNKMEELFEKLMYAKNSVRWLLDHDNGNVDFHGHIFKVSLKQRILASQTPDQLSLSCTIIGHNS